MRDREGTVGVRPCLLPAPSFSEERSAVISPVRSMNCNTEPVRPQGGANCRPDRTSATGDHGNSIRHYSLLPGKAKLCLPRPVGLDDLPIALCDVFWIEGRARDDLPGDRQRRHSNAIWFQVGSEHGGRRTECCLAQGNGRQRRDWVICETTTRHHDGARTSGAHGWSGDLRQHDGAYDVHRISRLQVFNSRLQELVRSSHDRVVDDDTGSPLLS